MMPVYENLYVKQFVLYNDESVNYYFQESGNGEMITTDKKTLKTDKERVFAGKISDAECNDRYGFGCGTFESHA